MDPPMLALWRRIRGPLPGGLRLYGGTAVALYLGHRNSTDFDFVATADVVDEGFAASLPWLKGGRINGGPGMIDAVVDSEDHLGNSRPVTVTLMETGPLVFEPRHRTTTAANGVEVAHPIDIMACKMRACASRGAANDYCDLAAMLRVWPGWSGKAVEIVTASHFSLVSVCTAITSPPDSAAGDIPLTDREMLAATAVRLLEGLERSGDRPHG